MARSAKTRTDKAADAMIPERAATIPDAEVIGETLPSQDAVAEPVIETAVQDDPAATETVVVEPAQDDVIAPEPVNAPDPAPESEVEPLREEPQVPPRHEAFAPPPPPQVTVQKVGFVPLVLGGVVAAAVGFAAGWQGLLPSRDDGVTAEAIASQGARIDEVAAAVAAVPAPLDLGPVQAEVAALRADLAPLAERIAALERRMEALERAPANDGTLSGTAIAAWQQDIEDLKAAMAAQAEETAAITDAAEARDAELAGLQDAMAAQQAEMARMVEEAAARLDAAQSTVAGIEQEATAAATATLRRAVLASLQTAVDGGQPYANLLGELAGTGVEVPEGLAVPAAEGVATLAALGETFPDAARAALAAARAEGLADDGGGGVMGFLRSQLDVRSVEPREGDDPDAILSRAEAALREARLGDALAEVATLPEVVRAPMGDWVAAAEARVAALSALQSLAESLPVSETSN